MSDQKAKLAEFQNTLDHAHDMEDVVAAIKVALENGLEVDQLALVVWPEFDPGPLPECRESKLSEEQVNKFIEIVRDRAKLLEEVTVTCFICGGKWKEHELDHACGCPRPVLLDQNKT